MKVCILTSAHPPDDARIYYKEACSLAKAGYEVVFIVPWPGREEERPREALTPEGIKIRYAPPFANRRQRWRNGRAIYRLALAEKAQAYHFHDPDLIALGLRLQRKTGSPVIYDVHEYYSDGLRTRYWIPAVLRRPAAWLFDKREKRAARRFAALITVNEHMEAQFKRCNPESIVLYNYPLEAQFDFPPPGQEEKEPVLFYLGGISRERGLEVLLRAMPLVKARCPQVRCEMVGPVDTGGLSGEFLPLEPWLEKGNIRLWGKVPYEEVPGLLKEAQVALAPLLATENYRKAIPVKLIEYMAAGLPVVGSDFGYMKQIIETEQCGSLAQADDPRDLAEKILALLADPREAAACGYRGWQAFHGKYCWEKEEKKLWDLYERLLGGA